MKYLLSILLLSSVLVFQACSKVGPSVADSDNLASQAVTALALDDAYLKGGTSLVLTDEAAALINSGAFNCGRGTEDDSSSEDGLKVSSKGSGSSSHDSASQDSQDSASQDSQDSASQDSQDSASHDSQDSASQDSQDSASHDSQDSASEDNKCDRNKKVKVCHRTPEKDITLCVSIKSLKRHLNHGGQRIGRQDGSGEELKDFLGDCTAVPPGSNPTTTTQAPTSPTTTQAPAPTTTQAPPAPTTTQAPPAPTTTTTTLPFDPGQF